MTAPSMKCRRELAHRASNGIKVFLFWDACSNDVSIEVVDQCEGSVFELGVSADSALDAFYDPYAYLAFSGIELEQEPPLTARVVGTTTRRAPSPPGAPRPPNPCSIEPVRNVRGDGLARARVAPARSSP